MIFIYQLSLNLLPQDRRMALIKGTQGNDVLVSSHGGNTLDGLGGDDVLVGGYGNDILIGGDGNDIIAPGLGTNNVNGGAGFDVVDVQLILSSVSFMRYGGQIIFSGSFSNGRFSDTLNFVEAARFTDGGVHFSNDPLYDFIFYAKNNWDVYASGMAAQEHFDIYGWHEGRDPNAYFSTKYYLANNADVATAGINPVLHYEQYGWKEGRNPSAGFDGKAYLQHNVDVAEANLDPLFHFISYGIFEGRSAHTVVA
jgi:hypothetical protein